MENEKKIRLWQVGTIEMVSMKMNKKYVVDNAFIKFDKKNRIRLFKIDHNHTLLFDSYSISSLYAKLIHIFIDTGFEFRLFKTVEKEDFFRDDNLLIWKIQQDNSCAYVGGDEEKMINTELKDLGILDNFICSSIYEKNNIGICAGYRSVFICALDPFKIIRVLQQHELKKPYYDGENVAFYKDIIMDSEGECALVITKDESVLKFIPHWSFLGPQKNFDETKKIAYDIYLNYV